MKVMVARKRSPIDEQKELSLNAHKIGKTTAWKASQLMRSRRHMLPEELSIPPPNAAEHLGRHVETAGEQV